jgi:hypothetical protein
MNKFQQFCHKKKSFESFQISDWSDRSWVEKRRLTKETPSIRNEAWKKQKVQDKNFVFEALKSEEFKIKLSFWGLKRQNNSDKIFFEALWTHKQWRIQDKT